MNQAEVEVLAAHAADSVFSFADFAKRTEHLFAGLPDAEALQAYKSAWFELEIVNATALDEWEADGRPMNWGDEWKERFQNDAMETVGMVRAAALRLAE